MLNVNAECFDRSVIGFGKFAVHVLCTHDNVTQVVDTYLKISVEDAFNAFKDRVDGFLLNSKADLSDFDAFTEVEPGCNMAIFSVVHKSGVKYQLNFVEVI
jgi:hypothetical protein